MSILRMLTPIALITMAACQQREYNHAGIPHYATESEIKEAWNRANNPLQFNQDMMLRFDWMPLKATLTELPWSDSYWPSYMGGLSQRWFGGALESTEQFKYKLHTKDEVKNLSENELKKLSPAEKFDIYNGNYDYPTVQLERRRVSPKNQKWEGLCHGWAAASYLFKEPKPVTLQNQDGVKVPFGAADVKALLSYAQGQQPHAVRTAFVGTRCNLKGFAANFAPECKDTNAGAFHVILVNQIARRNESFIADVTRTAEVWNHPVYHYESKIVSTKNGASRKAAPGTVKEVTLETVMTYAVETDPVWAAHGPGRHAKATKNYSYRVELNASGNVIGGEWISSERPDFLWKSNATAFAGAFSSVGAIYEASIQ